MAVQVAIDEQGRETVVIHYLHQEFGVWKLACSPWHNFEGTAPTWMRSNDTRAVTCKQCQETETFQQHHAELLAALSAQQRRY